MPMRPERVLVIAHGHPDFALGGGELAAWREFETLRAHPGVEAAWLLARAELGRGASGEITLRRDGEYLWEQGIRDWHLLRGANGAATATRFVEFVQSLAPTVVHVHHVVHLGLEMLRELRRALPAARIVMTLHEFIAICQNDGQMIRRGTQALCESASAHDCHRCFPAHSPEDFWLRRRFMLGHFDAVDAFVAPSRFLRERYVAWGLPPERIQVIENGQPDEPPAPPRPLRPGETRRRFGFFGQVNPYKGLDLLLEALHRLEPAARARVALEVNCANLELQPAPLRERIEALAEPLIEQGVVVWRGPYRPSELRRRMAAVDWVCVPSIWWENSPLVIQEAFRFGRPVLCSDIGGMAEKVRDGIDGLHVPVRDVQAWGEALLRAAADDALWQRLADGIGPVASLAESVDRHLRLFAELRAGDRAPADAGGRVVRLVEARA
jgi:glycosyltransferase involved in cell wall biosynthesis